MSDSSRFDMTNAERSAFRAGRLIGRNEKRELSPAEQDVVDRARKLLDEIDADFDDMDHGQLLGRLENLVVNLLRIIDEQEANHG